MEQEKLRTEAIIIFKGKEIPKGRILVVGTDVTAAEAEVLKSMGRQISVLTDVQMSQHINMPPGKIVYAGPSVEELEQTRRYIERLEKENKSLQELASEESDARRALQKRYDALKADQEQLALAANYLGSITAAELVAVLKARKTKIPAEATREQLLELLITQATNQEVPT